MKISLLLLILIFLIGCNSTPEPATAANPETFDTFSAVYDVYPYYVSERMSLADLQRIRDGDFDKVSKKTEKFWGRWWFDLTPIQKQEVAKTILEIQHQGE